MRLGDLVFDAIVLGDIAVGSTDLHCRKDGFKLSASSNIEGNLAIM